MFPCVRNILLCLPAVASAEIVVLTKNLTATAAQSGVYQLQRNFFNNNGGGHGWVANTKNPDRGDGYNYADPEGVFELPELL